MRDLKRKTEQQKARRRNKGTLPHVANKGASDPCNALRYGADSPLVKIGNSKLRLSTGNRIWTIHRQNQHHQSSSDLKRLIGRVRQRIEGVFHEIQNTGRNPERLLSKTVRGLTTHMAAKIASHTLRLLLRERFAIDVLTFQLVTPAY